MTLPMFSASLNPTGESPEIGFPSGGAVDFHLAVMAGDDAVDDGEASPVPFFFVEKKGSKIRARSFG